MYTVDDFDWGEFVRCNGRIMFIQDAAGDDHPGMLGLQTEDAPPVYDHDWSTFFPEVKYYPVAEVEKLTPVKATEEELRRFFRLEATPWELAAKNRYPFSGESGPVELKEEDLGVFVRNFPSVDSIGYDAWEDLFCRDDVMICRETDYSVISLAFAWGMMNDVFAWFDSEEDSKDYIKDIWEFYQKSKGKKLTEIEIPDYFRNDIIERIRIFAKQNKPSVEQVELYVRLLNEKCEEGDTWALNEKAYAYYGGNGVVPCDWKQSEQALLKLYEKGVESAADSLGYIYYSNRLGEPDYEKAFFYFSKAAEIGMTEGLYKQADMYRKGHGVGKDAAKAYEIYSRLFEEQMESYRDGYGAKLADVALRMGYCYENGEGVEKDIAKAREFFELAREAITKRIRHNKQFGDEIVERNINQALERVNSYECE